MSANDLTTIIITAVVSSLVGSVGIVGLLFGFIRRYLTKKLDAKDQANTKKKDLAKRRKAITDEKEHAEGRLFFWIHKAIVDGEHNGDLEHAWQLYQEAEQKEKELDREIIVDSEQ